MFGVALAVAGLISLATPLILLLAVPEPSGDRAKELLDTLAWVIPLVVMGGLALIRLLLAPYWIYRNLAGNPIQESIDELGALLTEGYELTRRDIDATSPDETVDAWFTEANEWVERVSQRLGKIPFTSADVSLFETDQPEQGFQTISTLEHVRFHNGKNHVERLLGNLREIIIRYSAAPGSE